MQDTATQVRLKELVVIHYSGRLPVPNMSKEKSIIGTFEKIFLFHFIDRQNDFSGNS